MNKYIPISWIFVGFVNLAFWFSSSIPTEFVLPSAIAFISMGCIHLLLNYKFTYVALAIQYTLSAYILYFATFIDSTMFTWGLAIFLFAATIYNTFTHVIWANSKSE